MSHFMMRWRFNGASAKAMVEKPQDCTGPGLPDPAAMTVATCHEVYIQEPKLANAFVEI